MYCQLNNGYTCNIIFNKNATLFNNDVRIVFSDILYPSNYSFNSRVVFPDDIKNMREIFFGLQNFNQRITLPKNAVICTSMFANCISFNQPVTIPENVEYCGGMFMDCSAFNSPVTMADSVIDCSVMFMNCDSFNQPVRFSESTKNMQAVFSYCSIYNSPIYVPDSVPFGKYDDLVNVNSFKSSISVPHMDTYEQFNTTLHMYGYLFSGEEEEDDKIGITLMARDDGFVDVIQKYQVTFPSANNTIPPTISTYVTTDEYISALLAVSPGATVVILESRQPYLENEPPHYNNASYNSKDDLKGITNCSYYYKGCEAYNQPTTIPNTALRADGMFIGCSTFNQPITFEN